MSDLPEEVPADLPEAPLDELDLDFEDEESEEGESEEEAEEGAEEGAEGTKDAEDAEGAPAKKPKAKSKKDEDPDAEVVHKAAKIPSKQVLSTALAWAFEGEDIEPELVERYADYAGLLLEWNKKMNLTAIVEPREVAAKHFLDCWRMTRLLSLVGRHVLDLGTGAGFPGLVLAMAEPNTRVTLVDGTQKRIAFLEHAIEKLGVKNVSAEWIRGEDFLATQRVDIVTMRAISSIRENVRTLRKVRHAVKDVVMFKGSSWSREVRAGEREAERLGFTLDTVWEHELPDEMGGRAILVYRAPGGQGL